MTLLLIANLFIGTLILSWWWFQRQRRQRRLQRQGFIQQYRLPWPVLGRFRQTYPELSDADLALVQQGLRQFFTIHLASHPKVIGMPSKAIDALWHAFILDTRAYQAFCAQAFGHFFDHLPAESGPDGAVSVASIRRTWREACRLDGLPMMNATSLPMPWIFQLDQQLRIPNGICAEPDPSWLIENRSVHRSHHTDDGAACGGGGGTTTADGDD